MRRIIAIDHQETPDGDACSCGASTDGDARWWSHHLAGVVADAAVQRMKDAAAEQERLARAVRTDALYEHHAAAAAHYYGAAHELVSWSAR